MPSNEASDRADERQQHHEREKPEQQQEEEEETTREDGETSPSSISVPVSVTIDPPSSMKPATLTVVDDNGNGNNSTSISTTSTARVLLIGSPTLIPKHQGRNFLVMGRQVATCDIRISHKSLSRQHAVLYYDSSNLTTTMTIERTTTTKMTTKGGDDDTTAHTDPTPPSSQLSLYLMDLNTKSGTFINNVRITPHTPIQLQMGDRIRLGKDQHQFIVHWNKHQTDDNHDNNDNKTKKADVNTTTTKPMNMKSDLPSKEGNNNNDNHEPILTGRAQRQAEIAAMMASLDEDPTYTKFDSTNNTTTAGGLSSSFTNRPPEVDTTSTKRELRLMDKYKLPLQDSTSWATNIDSSISAVTMDPSGARFAVGSMDSALRLYDFGGLNIDNPTPFQNVYIQEGYPVRSIAFAPAGDRYVVATGSSQPRMMDRDGSEELLEFARGDVYVIDPSKTIGHTASVTCIQWHPVEKSIVYTTSRDGSLRRWNVDKGKLAFGMLKCDDVIVIKNLKTGRKTIPTCMAITSKLIAMGTECGSIQIYPHPFQAKLRPQQSTIVHSSDTDKGGPSNIVSSVIFSIDGSKLACRTSVDVSVYNMERRLSASSSPLLVCTKIGTTLEDDDSTPTIAFSPDGKVICIGVTDQTSIDGVLHSQSRIDVYVIPKGGSSEEKKSRGPILSQSLENNDPVVGLSWHFKLNQLLVATTKSFSVWYSRDHSQKGVMLNVRGTNRRAKRKVEDDLQDLYDARAPPPGSNFRYEEIVVPNALPMFGGDSKQKRKQKKLDQQEEDNKRKNPQQPAKSVYNTHNTIFAQLVVDNQTVDQKIIAGKDPREALAKYSEGKSYISTAYEGNKERILAERTIEEDEDEMKKR